MNLPTHIMINTSIYHLESIDTVITILSALSRYSHINQSSL